ncbi:hypothetical protein [Pseudodesulfovibrio piezophilus]|uniref:hypothetical protein n=1 Tax=Pseudodesulfovibrio piezophilus TaxID=879567 RepID=UPI000349294B|nr:hypothetical protein [Pseudodesulfovibrio piezophilus]
MSADETLWREQSTPTLTALEWANAHLDFARQRFVPKVYEAKQLAFMRLLEVFPGDRQVNELRMPQAMAIMQSVATQRGNGPANTARKHLSSAWAWGTKYLTCSCPETIRFRWWTAFPPTNTPGACLPKKSSGKYSIPPKDRTKSF